MRQARAWLVRAASMFRRSGLDNDLARELDAHLQFHIDDNIRAGMPPDEARRRALIALGGVDQIMEMHRDRRGIPMLETLLRDLRHGVRGLLKSPGFALAAIVILGLGIGVNTAIFTVVNAVLLRPLPFAEADRIMRLWHTPPAQLFTGRQLFALSPANFLDWQAQNQVFERMSIYRGTRLTLTGRGEPESVIAGRVSSDFFPIVGLPPVLGRGFSAEDDRAGGPKIVMLSEGLWRRQFGADPSVIGRTLSVDLEPRTIVGVAPDVPVFIDTVQVWIPLAWTAEERLIRNNHNYMAIAKLEPGVDVARAQADLTTISQRLELEYPADNKGWGALVLPLQEDMVGDVRASLFMLLGATGLVLLIACANLANLLLLRTYARGREIAVRAALGAGRARIVGQLLVEGVILGAAGGAAGFLAAFYGVRAMAATFGAQLPRAAELVPDARVFAMTALVAAITGIVAAAVPAWRATGHDPYEALKRGPGRGNSSTGDGRMRNVLVVSEVALALMLLVGAGLLLRSLMVLRATDVGFDSRNLLTAEIGLPEAKYSTPQQRIRFFEQVVESIRALPGVESAAAIDSVPFEGGSAQPVATDATAGLRESELPVVAVRITSPGYFSTARIPITSGRDFDARDTLQSPGVVVVSELAASRFWPNQNPIGKRLTLGLMSDGAREVIGVVGEVKTEQPDDPRHEPALYLPTAQTGFDGTTLFVRTSVPPDRLSRAVVGAVQAIDPDQPVVAISTMEAIMERSLGQRRFAMLLLAGFAALALTLASVGIYSVLAYVVRQRVREIGIRMALGASSTSVLRMVVVEGLKPTLAGAAIGLVLAILLARTMTTLLYGVSAHDTSTFTAVAGLVVLVGAIAASIPAFRATRVDPVTTLRAE